MSAKESQTDTSLAVKLGYILSQKCWSYSREDLKSKQLEMANLGNILEVVVNG